MFWCSLMSYPLISGDESYQNKVALYVPLCTQHLLIVALVNIVLQNISILKFKMSFKIKLMI
ncbi:conserved hypothetical protein [Vibrio chagasii]|nr:conserved hypothetical protein [Vibrio chagasii]CAH6984264.1 conserved hypothetical protein [Vibrio chagasii]CAH7032570.1 conserved hypothetical protein [Vibrio chagasii]